MPKKILKSKKNQSQNKPPEKNVMPVPAKSQIFCCPFGRNWLNIIFQRIVLEAAQIWREMAPHYFPVDCFGGSSDLAGTGTTLFSGGLFWRKLRFGRNWFHIIFQRIVLEAAQIWQVLAPHYFPADCFGGSSDLAGTGSTLFSGGLFWRQLRFGGNWLFFQVVI